MDIARDGMLFRRFLAMMPLPFTPCHAMPYAKCLSCLMSACHPILTKLFPCPQSPVCPCLMSQLPNTWKMSCRVNFVSISQGMHTTQQAGSGQMVQAHSRHKACTGTQLFGKGEGRMFAAQNTWKGEGRGSARWGWGR